MAVAYFTVLWTRSFASAHGVVVEAERRHDEGELLVLWSGEQRRYQIPHRLVRAVEEFTTQGEAAARLRSARERLRGGGPGAATFQVDEGSAPVAASGGALVERRAFAIDERVLPQRRSS